jgi:hypothetical protein
MRYRELIEAQPVKPLTPAAATKRAARLTKAQNSLSDTRKKAAINIAAKARKLTEL